MELYKNIPTCYACDQRAWRNWLEANADSQKAVFLIIYKKDSGVPSVTYGEAVDEALCFGWVDSKINKRDEKSWYQYFAKRNPKSNWSRINKLKIEKLILDYRMAPSGLESVRIAHENGSWSALDVVDNLTVPAEMQSLLISNPTAAEHWENFSISVKRNILEWIYNAKKTETKMDRIKKTVVMATENKRANIDK
jgi:uncharacterized protein YdeI (YjbR/CyaY-like superfamily)